MKKLANYIGQKQAVARLNQIATAANNAKKAGERFYFPVIKLGGLTGLGKSELAECFADCFQKQFVEMPIGAGWTWLSQTAKTVTSQDDERGTVSAIPATIYVDEAHSQKTLANALKKLIEKDVSTFERNGTKWHTDMSEHLWIFASNEMLDKALERRCEVQIELSPYTCAEKKQLLAFFLSHNGTEASEETIAYLETRAKPTAADCKMIAKNASFFAGSFREVATARKLVEQMGRFHCGLDRGEIRGLEFLEVNKTANASALRHRMGYTGATGEKKVRDSMGFLACSGFVDQISVSSFMIANDGKKYLTKLRSDIASAKQAAK